MEENQAPKFVDSPEELSVNQEQQPQYDATTAPEQPTPMEQPQAQETPTEQQPVDDYSFTATSNESSLQNDEDNLESSVLEYLTERLGRDISSFDDLNNASYQVDESVQSISKFVQETGRRPEDWFTYQSLNTERMDDMTAVMVDMSSKYPNLSQEEIRTLVTNKYKIDENLYNEDEVKFARLQLKIDSQESRKAIEDMREKYKSEYVRQEPAEDIDVFDQEWLETMRNETMALEAIEFDLGQGQEFKFGLDESYNRSLVNKNQSIENFFDDYINDDGDWNFDKFNADRTVLDNINKIVSAVYRKGLGDGQRGLLNASANVRSTSPQMGNQQPSSDPLSNQIRQAMGMGNSMTFKL
jgi:hypothetical protein